jgi:hypothetical protein
MSIIGSNILAGASGQAGGYQIKRSLRFNSSDSGFCSRTPAVAGDRKTWTWAGWVKRSNDSGYQVLFSANNGNSTAFDIAFNGDNFGAYLGIGPNLVAAAVYRDFSAWYHILCAVDTTQATASSRIKLYVNGQQIASFSASNYPSQNFDYDINNTTAHAVGRVSGVSSGYFPGSLAEVFFIDGQALDHTSFTEVSATTGQLIPIEYTGTFGTNGFHLPFSDNSTAAALGTDTSGNGNTWTVNNISVTAGAGNDSLVDTPTSYGTPDTGVGNEVRGNYCTMNPLLTTGSACTFSNGNLETAVSSIGSQRAWGTFGVSSGKWYFEYTQTSGSYAQGIGIKSTFNSDNNNNYIYTGYDGTKVNASGSATSYGATWGINDVIGVAFDLDNATITFYKNGASQGTAFTGIDSGTYFPWFLGWSGGSGVNFTMNFGQRAFAYTAPSGFKALCDTNLPEPTIADGSTVMDVALYTGNGGTQSITGLNFSPDFVWIKQRDVVRSHQLFDIVRGANNVLFSDTTDDEQAVTGRFDSFDSTGFSLGSSDRVNGSGGSYAAWSWDAGTTTASNPDGSITSQVRANASAGFSVVSWTHGSNTNPTVNTLGHGLGVVPSLVIVKTRTSGASNWLVKSEVFSDPVRDELYLNTTAAKTTAGVDLYYRTSSVLGFRETSIGGNGDNMIAYCWAPVAGYSAALSWTGNGSNDGTMIYCGFSPRFWIWKRTDTTGDWWMIDTARSNTGNPVDEWLAANRSDAEYPNDGDFDFLSNGIKIRTTSTSVNASGGSYIGFAWASNPFQYARAQ